MVDRVAAPDPAWDSAAPDPATSSAPYRIYNIGNNQPVPLMTYIETIERAVGKEAVKNFLPMQPGDVPETYADVDDLARDVGFRPSTRWRRASRASWRGTAIFTGSEASLASSRARLCGVPL